jgi:hypothetical protein
MLSAASPVGAALPYGSSEESGRSALNVLKREAQAVKVLDLPRSFEGARLEMTVGELLRAKPDVAGMNGAAL